MEVYDGTSFLFWGWRGCSLLVLVWFVHIMVDGVFLSVQVMDRASGEFARAQVLARKMALNLGIDGAKNREAVVNIHRSSQIKCKSLGFCSFGGAVILGRYDINILKNTHLHFNSDENKCP